MPRAPTPERFGAGALIVHGFTIPLDGYNADEPLLAGIDLPKLGYTCGKSVTGERAVHYRITRA